MNRTKIITLLFLAVLISNFSLAADRIVANYHGNKVLKSEVTKRIKEASGGKMPQGKNDLDDYPINARQELIANYVQEKLLTSAAENMNIEKNPAYKKQLENFIRQSKVRSYVEKYIKENLTPLMIRDSYNKYVKALKAHNELKISHILLRTEADANKVLAELNAKKITFANAAKKYSLDTGSKDKNGDVGYMKPGRFVPEFERAASNLKKGETSKAVKTNFGWHVIKVTDSRKPKIPSFNEVKDRLTQQIKIGLIQKHVAHLMQKARVQIFANKNKK